MLEAFRNIDIYFQSKQEKGCLKSTIYTLEKRVHLIQTQLRLTCSKSTIETVEKDVKYIKT